MINENIYARLEELGTIELICNRTESATSKSSGFMDLHFDRLREENGSVVISLAHYFEQNGDLCCDPDMEIRVYPKLRSAEALTFQQAIPPVYQVVYPAPGKVNLGLKSVLNDFLLTWLGNCIQQGHRLGGGA
jgi:hypothetical protein